MRSRAGRLLGGEHRGAAFGSRCDYRPRTAEGAGKLSEDRQVGVQLHALTATNAERQQRPFVLQTSELALDRAALGVEVAPPLASYASGQYHGHSKALAIVVPTFGTVVGIALGFFIALAVRLAFTLRTQRDEARAARLGAIDDGGMAKQKALDDQAAEHQAALDTQNADHFLEVERLKGHHAEEVERLRAEDRKALAMLHLIREMSELQRRAEVWSGYPADQPLTEGEQGSIVEPTRQLLADVEQRLREAGLTEYAKEVEAFRVGLRPTRWIGLRGYVPGIVMRMEGWITEWEESVSREERQ